MAYTTASALVDVVRVEADYSGGTDTVLYARLNDFLLRLQREHDWTFQEQIATRSMTTAASGFSRFAQPTDCKEIQALYLIESSERKELDYFDYQEAIRNYPDPSQTAQPEGWTLFRDEIIVLPSLHSAITVEAMYFRFLPEMAATSSNDFLVWTPDILRFGLLTEYYDWIGEPNKAQRQQEKLSDAVTSALKYHRAAKVRPMQDTVLRTPGTLLKDPRGRLKRHGRGWW